MRIITNALFYLALSFSLSLFLVPYSATAHNKVVVVPLLGESSSPIKNVVVVALENGDFTSPVAAINSIMDADANNPYLLAIAPGEYDLGATPLQMKPFVEITGSGVVATRLIGTIGSSTDDATAAVVAGASDSSLSNLAIVNTRTNSNSFGIYNGSVSNMEIKNVSIFITNGPASGFQVGILNDASTTKIANVSIELVDGGQQMGVYNRNGSNTDLSELDFLVDGGTSYQYGVGGFGSSPTEIKSSSMLITNGASRQWGISAGSASPIKAKDLDIEVTLGTTGDQIGIELAVQPQDGSSSIYRSTINTEDGADAWGISITQAGLATLSDVSAKGSGATGVSYGITLNLLVEAKIHNSVLSGTTNSILVATGVNAAVAYIDDSFLDGAVSGTPRCSFVHTISGTLLDSSCSAGP